MPLAQQHHFHNKTCRHIHYALMDMLAGFIMNNDVVEPAAWPVEETTHDDQEVSLSKCPKRDAMKLSTTSYQACSSLQHQLSPDRAILRYVHRVHLQRCGLDIGFERAKQAAHGVVLGAPLEHSTCRDSSRMD
jgi:hypothetical protein